MILKRFTGLHRNFSCRPLMEEEKLDKFGRKLPVRQGGFYLPSLTTDAVVMRTRTDGDHDILMITRKNHPFQGQLAFPGGFVNYNEEPLFGCLRELQEECGVVGKNPKLITVAGDPQRDPRGHVVSIVYSVELEPTEEVRAGDDAATAQFYPLAEILQNSSSLAFDHGEILKKAVLAMGAGQKYGLN